MAFDTGKARVAIRRIMEEAGNDLSQLSTKRIRKSLEESWGCGLKEHRETIDELVMERVVELREGAKAPPSQAQHKGKRASTTPRTGAGAPGKKKARVSDTAAGSARRDPARPSSAISRLEAEEARLQALVKRCKLSRPRNLNKLDDDERVEKLRQIVTAALGSHKPEKGAVAAYLAKKAREFELDGIDTSNIIDAPAVSSSGRPRRSVGSDFLAPCEGALAAGECGGGGGVWGKCQGVGWAGGPWRRIKWCGCGCVSPLLLRLNFLSLRYTSIVRTPREHGERQGNRRLVKGSNRNRNDDEESRSESPSEDLSEDEEHNQRREKPPLQARRRGIEEDDDTDDGQGAQDDAFSSSDAGSSPPPLTDDDC
ncbi:hypothetical protein AB1Y20_001500 [Prymnesium parvum]|uniref:DEK-C domain-containing protein n=1 Tax=Prymnesium parvum TaxID=97485 RepID=A0AB34K8U9_PRYPA